jgi:hypothetical protein
MSLNDRPRLARILFGGGAVLALAAATAGLVLAAHTARPTATLPAISSPSPMATALPTATAAPTPSATATPIASPTATPLTTAQAQLITVAEETYRTICNGEATASPVPVGAACTSMDDAVMDPCSAVTTPLPGPYANCPFTAEFTQKMIAVAPEGQGEAGAGAAQLCQCQGFASEPTFTATVTPTGGTVTWSNPPSKDGSVDVFVITIVSDDGQLLVNDITYDGTSITQQPYNPGP